MHKTIFLLMGCVGLTTVSIAQVAQKTAHPVRTEVITPIHKTSFTNNGSCAEKKQGGNPQTINGYQVFSGSTDGNRQVDPQIAVGGGYVLHGTNSGLYIYTKQGEYVAGVSQKCFNDGIDPKLCFDVHNRIFIFNLWWYYDKPKIKPANIAVSETDNPTGAWNIYPVSVSEGEDGGAVGYSKKWIAYSFPGGSEQTFVLKTADAKAGKPAKVYHFKGSLGHPIFMQDNLEDLYFFEIEENDFVIRKITADAQGEPYTQLVARKPHGLQYIDYPPQSPQKGTKQLISSGDRNPKNLVFQSGSIWFSQAVHCEGRSAVQWHQVNPANASIQQTGIIRSATTNYIQTTIAVNTQNDVLIGFQQTDSTRFVSPRFVYRTAKDKPGTVREIVSVGEGKGAADGVAWGDYSGSMVDGDNLLDLWTVQSITNDKGKGETVIIQVPISTSKKKKGT